jgi:tetratricopeptide (TPR) repeat protein
MIMVLGTVNGQSPRDEFLNKLNEAYDILYSDPHKAIEVGMDAYHLAEDKGDQWGMAIGHSGMAYISYEVGDYEASYKNNVAALRALKAADTTDLYNETLILNHLSIIYSDFNNHDESIRYAKQALEVAKVYLKNHRAHAESKGALGILVDISYNMAIQYQAKGAHQSAGQILVNLWEDAEDKEDIALYAEVLNELGIVKTENAEYSEAQEYFGLVVSGADVYQEDKTVAYHNLAVTYMKQGKLPKAESYFLISLDMAKELEDGYSQFVTYQDLGELEHKRGNIDQAIKYWETGLSVYDDLGNDPGLYSVYNWLQLAYMDIDVEKAKEFNQTYAKLNDFYVKNQAYQREQEAQNRLELNNIIDSERQDRVDAEQRNRFIQQFWPLFVGVGLLILFSMIMGVRYYRAIRANKELSSVRAAGVSADSE